MKIFNKKRLMSVLIWALFPLSAWGAVSVTVPGRDGGGIHIEKHKYDRDYRYRGERICREVTREKCKRKCRWNDYHGMERCQIYCVPVREYRCWYRD